MGVSEKDFIGLNENFDLRTSEFYDTKEGVIRGARSHAGGKSEQKKEEKMITGIDRAVQKCSFFIFYSARLDLLVVGNIAFAGILASEAIDSWGLSRLGAGLVMACVFLIGSDLVESCRLLRLTIWRRQPNLLLEDIRVFDSRLVQGFCLAGRFLWLALLSLWLFFVLRSTTGASLIQYVLLAWFFMSNGALAWCDGFLCFRKARERLIIHAANR